MILSGQTIRARHFKKPLLKPFFERATANGMSYGLGPAGYDVRLGAMRQHGHRGFGPTVDEINLPPGGFALGVTLEWMHIPNDLMGFVKDKSSWARKGICLQCTVVEPGWAGFLTLEITNHSAQAVRLMKGMPIAQIIFEALDQPAEKPYRGKYNNQRNEPVEAIVERPQVRERA